MSENFQAPVALFVFNRPEHTERVLAQLAAYDYPELVIYSDGPRQSHPKDDAQIQRVRELIKSESQLRRITLVPQDSNLGLLDHFSFGLRDFFSKHESGIILEDDCLPTKSFFDFCNFGLVEFRDDDSVAMVQGSSFLPRFASSLGDFYLGKDFKVWGWATWANRLEDFDPKLEDWRQADKTGQVASLRAQGSTLLRASKERQRLQKALALGTWDIQLSSHFKIKKLRSISPGQNLILNIGFGQDATHTFWGGFTIPRGTGQVQKPFRESRIVLPLVGLPLESMNRMALFFLEAVLHPSNFWSDSVGFFKHRSRKFVRSREEK